MIPELLRIAVFQKGRIRGSNAANLLFPVPFWCAMGIAVGALYRAQTVWFGSDAAFPVVTKKVLVAQFIYNPLFAAPSAAVFQILIFSLRQATWNGPWPLPML